jgi:enoyl-CoA hydratase
MNFSTITFQELQAGVGLLTLNRPERLNGLNMAMLDDLQALFQALALKDDIRVLILTGAGRGFCSGADLKDDRRIKDPSFPGFTSPAGHLVHIQKKYADRILEMRRLPQPIIAAVNGPAAGGGMCLALASDVVIASEAATFTPSFINIGLSGGELGTTYFLPRAVGFPRAAEILMTGRTVNAEEAERMGMVTKKVPGEGLMAAALETAARMLAKSPMGLRFTKEALNLNIDAPSLQAAIELENRNQSLCCFSPEFLVAVQAFQKQHSSS